MTWTESADSSGQDNSASINSEGSRLEAWGENNPISATPRSQVPGWVILALLFLSISTLAAVGTAAYLYYWKTVVLNDNRYLVPEQWAMHVDKLSREIDSLKQASGTMTDTFMSFNAKLDEKDAEIRRLKKGYDVSILQKHLLKFARIDEAIREELKKGDVGRRSLEDIGELFEDALAEFDVERFEPQVGQSITDVEGMEARPKPVPTGDPELRHTIAEVSKPGYRISRGEAADVIIPAKVAVYVSDEKTASK